MASHLLELLFESTLTAQMPRHCLKGILQSISCFNPPLVLHSIGGFGSENHGFCTCGSKKAITQQQNGLWSPQKLHKLNNTHGEARAKYHCNGSNASFISIFSAQDTGIFLRFDAPRHNKTHDNDRDATPHNNTYTTTTTSTYYSND